MSKHSSLTLAKRQHAEKELLNYYNHRAQARLGDGEYKMKSYNVFSHYLPHTIALGTVVAATAYGLVAYNLGTRKAFESRYFSSW